MKIVLGTWRGDVTQERCEFVPAYACVSFIRLQLAAKL